MSQQAVERSELKALVSAFVLFAAWTAGCKDRPVPHAIPATTLPTSTEWFEDITTRENVAFTHQAGASVPYFMPQAMGSGAALLDFDNDGRLDLYLIQNGGPDGAKNQLFHQEPSGVFTDVSAGSGLNVAGWGMGVAAGDVNNDGFTDLLLTEYGRIRLFINQHNGTFADATAEAGLDDPGWATSAAMIDIDRDGWLDLVVANYIVYAPGRWCARDDSQQDYCGPNSFDGSVSRVFRNLGSSTPLRARFEDVSIKSKIGTVPGAGLGVYCNDFDGDGWPDILITNDQRRNHLWRNRHDGTFAEEGLQRGIAFNGMGGTAANMGIAAGDIDNDGLLDIFVTHLTTEMHTLWKQGPRGSFQDQTAASGITAARWRGTGFGSAIVDFDADGYPDLAIVNGRVYRGPVVARPAGKLHPFDPYWDPYAERNQLFRNDGHGRLVDISEENPALCGVRAVGRGLAVGDIDNDGRPDLLITSIGAPARILRNIAPLNGAHWLVIRAIDPALGGRDAYGAEISIEANGLRMTQTVNPAWSYLCSNDPRVHFGLGNTSRIDQISVRWPDGLTETFDATGSIDHIVTLSRGKGATAKNSR